MNKALRKHMLTEVLRFDTDADVVGAPSGSDTSGRLLQFMHSLSGNDTQSNKHNKKKKAFNNSWKSQFYLGPALSGAPLHHHGPAFNVLVRGRKEWILLPPGMYTYICF